jgi:predicted transcriptional regulator
MMVGAVANSNEAIISIHPKFAEAILCGSKTVELRRRIPNLEIGTRLWIYATRPTTAVIGSVIVDAIFRGSPELAWKKYSKQAAVERAEFDRYFDGAKEAVVILLRAAQRVRHVEIAQLRMWKEGFHPPQVLSRITTADAKRLHRLTVQ